MRAAIYNPYLDSLGGGERYSMAVASVLAKLGYQVDVEWKNIRIKEKLEKRFGIILDGVNFIRNIKRGDGYEICFWVSDGSIPALKARRNFLHFQIPFHGVNGKTLLNRMKLFRIKKMICNSKFTKTAIDKEYGVESIVVYPPVPVEQISPKRKENLVISVGRFSQLKQVKRQDVLVESFRKMVDSGLSGWKLVLAGGSEMGAGDFIAKLKELAEGYPIEILESPSFETLKSIYGKAKIFWSATGFGIDEAKEPEKVEHFGIAVVEAMAAGAVPLVYDGGGHREIVTKDVGFLWKNPRELISLTKNIIGQKIPLSKISKADIMESRNYGYEVFEREILKLI